MRPGRFSRATAYHEAGHAVAALMLGEGVHAIHIHNGAAPFVSRKGIASEPVLGAVEDTTGAPHPYLALLTLEGVARGAAANRSAPKCPHTVQGMWPQMWAKAVNSVFVLGAGIAAEAKHARAAYAPAAIWGTAAAGDRLAADRDLGLFVADAGERERSVQAIWSATRSLVTAGSAWAAVDDLARALWARGEGTMSGDEAVGIVASHIGLRPYAGSDAITDKVKCPPMPDLAALRFRIEDQYPFD